MESCNVNIIPWRTFSFIHFNNIQILRYFKFSIEIDMVDLHYICYQVFNSLIFFSVLQSLVDKVSTRKKSNLRYHFMLMNTNETILEKNYIHFWDWKFKISINSGAKTNQFFYSQDLNCDPNYPNYVEQFHILIELYFLVLA